MSVKELMLSAGFTDAYGEHLNYIKDALQECDEFKNKELIILTDLGFSKPEIEITSEGGIILKSDTKIETWTVKEQHAIFKDKISLYAVTINEETLFYRATPDSFHTGNDTSYRIYDTSSKFFDK